MTLAQLPGGVWQLTLAYACMMTGLPVTVLIAGIIGVRFAPSPGLATLPIALVIVGVALSTLPLGRLQSLYGRRRVFLVYGVLAMLAVVGAALSIMLKSFSAYCASALLTGWSAAAGHQYRFAALELVAPESAATATSVLLLGGILAAFLGPELAVIGKDLMAVEFAGSYLLLLIGYGVGWLLLSRIELPGAPSMTARRDAGRRYRELLSNRLLLLAVVAAGVGYAVMSLLMTATPIGMHEHAGHSLEATKWVIQSHIIAMYLPSIFFPFILRLLGFRGALWCGLLIYLLCISVAFADTSVPAYWASMVLLGLGWNLLYLSGTNILPMTYEPNERFRAQSMNDFIVFTCQAVASLGSGGLLFLLGWSGILVAGALLVAAFLVLLVWLQAGLPARRAPTMARGY